MVLAVAEPYLEHAVPVFSPGGNTHRVLVIDSSYSMAYKAADRTRFEQAKEWAARIVEESPQGDAFTLVLMAARRGWSWPRRPGKGADPRGDREPRAAAHRRRPAGHVGRGPQAARHGPPRQPRLTRQEVYFLSDLQRATWCRRDATRPRPTSAAVRRGWPRSPNCKSSISASRATTTWPSPRWTSATPVVLAGRSVALEAGVRDFGHVARQRQAVDLWSTAARRAGSTSTFPRAAVPSAFPARLRIGRRPCRRGPAAGDLLKPGDVRGPADALEVDNHRFLAVNVRQAIRVLCIDGRPAGDPRQSSVFNLARALPSRSDPNSRSPIEFDVAPESAVLERDLGRYDCVMLSDVAQFTASEARVLDNYLAHGGSLVFFLGDRVIAENYNSILAGQRRARGRSFRRGWSQLPRIRGGRLDPLDYRHPIVRKFRGQEEAGLLRSPIDQYFKVKLAGTPPGEQDQAVVRGAMRPSSAKGEIRNRAVRRSPSGRSRAGLEQRRSLDRGPADSPRPDRVGDDLGRRVLEPVAKMGHLRAPGEGNPRLVYRGPGAAAQHRSGRSVGIGLGGDAGPDGRVDRASRRSTPRGALGGPGRL